MSTPPDDPFAPSDATILRPRPGRRPAGAAAPPPGAAPAPAPPAAPPSPASYQAGPAPEIAEFVSSGRNPLLQAAVPLLMLAGRLRGQIANADVESLRRQCVQEVRSFEERARQAGVPAEDTLAARYALCTAIDEAVLNTPWGAQSGWAAQSLLVTFHREAQGGEKFFQLLERLVAEPERYLALLELWYLCLALGFEGRYRLDQRGAAQLADIRRDLYLRVEQLRGRPEPELSAHWKGVEDRRNAALRLVPLWVVAVAAAAILIGVWLLFNSRLSDRSSSLSAALASVGLQSLPQPVSSASLPPSALKSELGSEISQGLIEVEELPDRSRVTITVPDLFTSGSASVNARYVGLVHQIGAALNHNPGRILVIGHTDDQPIHSFQFHDNYELSHARAVAVARLLRRDVTDASRIQSAGKGDSDPRYKPPNLPANRARNRRVEIEQLRG